MRAMRRYCRIHRPETGAAHTTHGRPARHGHDQAFRADYRALRHLPEAGAPRTRKRRQEMSAAKRIALVGLPNTGKTHVFNVLTGGYRIVANYPHTTVETERGRCRIGDADYEVFDTPGIHSLYIHSEEEIAIRDLLFCEKPDIIVQCIDATHIRQSLALTAELLGLKAPLIVCLNAFDEARRNGIRIDVQALARFLDMPVVPIKGVDDRPAQALHHAIQTAGAGTKQVEYDQQITGAIHRVARAFPDTVPYREKAALLLLLRDRSFAGSADAMLDDAARERVRVEVKASRDTYPGNIARAISACESNWADTACEAAVTRRHAGRARFSEVFARLCRHPVFGFPILAFFVTLMYFAVVHVAGALEGLLSSMIVDPVVNALAAALPDGLLEDALVGHYGLLTLGVFNAFCTVLPILTVFFLIFGLLEDIGYIPNLVVLTKRVFEKAGLTGRSIMPLVLGFGCKTMATLTTRGLPSRKEKFIAIYLIAFAIPCSAQLGIDMAILGRVGFKAFLIAYGTLVLVEIAAGVILDKLIPDEARSDFIEQLPPIRMPNLKALLNKTYHRLYWFLKEAVPIFVIAAVALFGMEAVGLLDILKVALEPVVVAWLGLPLDIVDVLILTIARHEAAAGLLLRMVDSGGLTYIQSIVAVVITTMFVPCFANIVAICKELGVRAGIGMTLAINVSSFVLAGILSKILLATIGG
ncbi:MAG: ferrous iron transport protein B [Chitinivibrionales bacterium]|nr:ferrous iron transport protein B [Chitinivibrionales bacterium]MBD3394247.1 ferrous iron transport protein B [Chitinivibrionales bacterium]